MLVKEGIKRELLETTGMPASGFFKIRGSGGVILEKIREEIDVAIENSLAQMVGLSIGEDNRDYDGAILGKIKEVSNKTVKLQIDELKLRITKLEV